MVVGQTSRGRGHMTEGIIPCGVEEARSSVACLCHHHRDREGECQLQRDACYRGFVIEGTYQGSTTRRHPPDFNRALHRLRVSQSESDLYQHGLCAPGFMID